MKGRRAKIELKRLGKNIRHLRTAAGITVQGMAAATDLSVNHVRLIEAGRSNVTFGTILKFCNFFDTDISTLYDRYFPGTEGIKEWSTIAKFYDENQHNPQFFEWGNEDKPQYFIRKVLLKEENDYFEKEKREVDHVVRECRKAPYNKYFSSKAVSQALIRLVNAGLLEKADITGTGKRFAYFRRPKKERASSRTKSDKRYN